MIDLHTHTTASDGRCTPTELVARAAINGVTVLSVTDHDTVAGLAEAGAACLVHGIELVPGIEVTAVTEGRDVHVLGYFLDPAWPPFLDFLAVQRERRIERLRAILERLAASGVALDTETILGPALTDPSKAAGRPWIARELVRVGHVADITEAFDRWLAPGKPAFVPRTGATPAEVIERLHDASAVASLAHPALLRRDEWIGEFAAAGLDALETWHSKQDAADTLRYGELAETLGLAVSGGSDFHADDAHASIAPGSVSIPRDAFDGLRQRHQRFLATRRASASGSSTSS